MVARCSRGAPQVRYTPVPAEDSSRARRDLCAVMAPGPNTACFGPPSRRRPRAPKRAAFAPPNRWGLLWKGPNEGRGRGSRAQRYARFGRWARPRIRAPRRRADFPNFLDAVDFMGLATLVEPSERRLRSPTFARTRAEPRERAGRRGRCRRTSRWLMRQKWSRGGPPMMRTSLAKKYMRYTHGHNVEKWGFARQPA